jgi:hypothetical protein
MRLAYLLPALLLAAPACKKKKSEVPPPPPPADAAVGVKDPSTGANPPPRPLEALGEPFTATPDGNAGQPALGVAADGKALVAWIEAGSVYLRHWTGSGWETPAPPPNADTHQATGVPTLAVEPDGGVLLGWVEPDAGKVERLHVVRWKDGAWAPLGELGAGPVSDPAIAASPLGPLAVWRQPSEGDRFAVQVRVHEDGAWAPLGDGLLRGVAESTTLAAPVIATGGSQLVVGWIERTPALVTNIRRWDAAASAWVAVPSPEGADPSSTLALAVVPDGTITVSLSYSVGLRQLLTLAPGATTWKEIDVPEVSNGPARDQKLVGAEDGRAVFTYPFGGRLGWWDGGVWTATPVGMMAPSDVVPAVTAGRGGVVFVGWSAGKADRHQVRVLEVK